MLSEAIPIAPRPEGNQGTALKLWVVLTRAYQSIARHAEQDVMRHGLTLGEFAILEALYHKGALRLGELQQEVLVTSGGTTYLVDRLEAKGWVVRELCPEDRRVRYAALTSAGHAVIRDVFAEHARRMELVLGGLPPKDQREATTLLRTLGLFAAAQPVHGAG